MYARIFEQILDSSIADDYEVRHLMMDLLLLADEDGIIDMTHQAIVRRTNVPIKVVMRCIGVLSQPDKRSRTPDKEGRRLVKIDENRDWGWRIVNYDKFRKIRNKRDRKEYQRNYMRGYRQRQKAEHVENVSAPLGGKPHEDVNVAVDVDKKKKRRSVSVAEVRVIVDQWNTWVEKVGLIGTLRKLPKTGSPRHRSLLSRMQDLEWIRDLPLALMKAEKSDFLMGRATNWKITFDFLVTTEGVEKIMEGKYENAGGKAGPAGRQFDQGRDPSDYK